MIKHFNINTVGRDFVVGDIHGCFDILERALERVVFDVSIDRLFSVGDLVDRGSASEQSLKWLDMPWFHAVRGNHEQMAIGVAHGKHDVGNYIRNGGAWFVGLVPSEQMQFSDAFDSLPIAIEVDTPNGLVGIVHASCPYSDWDDFAIALGNVHSNSNTKKNTLLEECLWSRTRHNQFDCSDISGVDQVVVGHTPVPEDRYLGNVHYIDTGAVFGGKLTLLQIN